jgi:hypothetical protein
MTIRCNLCSQEFEAIPQDVVPIGRGRAFGNQTYRFPDGSIHDLREQKPQALTREQLSARAKLAAHNRRHANKNIKKEGCLYCFPKTLGETKE